MRKSQNDLTLASSHSKNTQVGQHKSCTEDVEKLPRNPRNDPSKGSGWKTDKGFASSSYFWVSWQVNQFGSWIHYDSCLILQFAGLYPPVLEYFPEVFIDYRRITWSQNIFRTLWNIPNSCEIIFPLGERVRCFFVRIFRWPNHRGGAPRWGVDRDDWHFFGHLDDNCGWSMSLSNP